MRSALAFAIGTLLAVQFLSREPLAALAPQTRPGGAPAAAPAPPPKPWPDAATLAQRRRDAENRRLFRSAEVLSFTLMSDFKAIDRDRDPASTKTFPGTIVFKQADGTEVSKPVQVRGRGHSRRNPQTCDFVPLRLEFTKDEMAGTVFEGHDALKLGTHCRSSSAFEQYVLREFTAYRIFNLVTPQSFRVRLAKATYVDAATRKPLVTRFAMFTEDDDDVAKRMEGRILDRPKLLFRDVDPEYTTLMAVFEYMIGNTDMSIYSLHNVRVVETPAGVRYPVPYDLDYSGLVNAIYAAVAPILNIENVRQRLYRGPCRPAEELEPAFAKMRALKPDIMALFDALPDLSDAYRKEARTYLEQFYRTIDRPADVKREFIDTCTRGGIERQIGM